MATRDYYEVLGVPPDASDETIKKSYRKLARQYHPDRVQGAGKADAETRFKEISAAYDTLGDPDKRKSYDELRRFGGTGGPGGTGPFGQSPFGGGSPFGQGAAYGRTRRPPGGFSTSTTGGPFEDILEAMFGSMRPAGGAAPAPSELEVAISLEEALAGTHRELTNPKSGKRIRVRIPPGIGDKAKVRAGEVVVEVHLKPHDLFERRDDDLTLELPVTFWEAIEGADVEVPTLDGSVKMKIPPRTQTGRKFRIKGKGLPHSKGEGRGDLFVKVMVHLPPEIDEQALALWRRLGGMTPYNPRAGMRRGG